MPTSRRVKKGSIPKPKAANNTQEPKAPVATKSEAEESVDDALERFPLELRWCLQQLEDTMKKKKSTPREAEDILKSYKVLAGQKAPLVKKRQLMRSLFGDYRKKMAEEEKKFKMGTPSLKTCSSAPSKSRFIKHKTHLGNDQPGVNDDKCIETKSVTADSIGEKETVSEVTSTAENSSKLNFNSESGNSFRFNFSVAT